MILTAVEAWREKEICTKGVRDGQKEREGRGLVGGSFPASFLTVLSNSQSNMAGRVNDCEPVTVTRPNKTAELQVNPLHPNICLHILHTVLYTFP